MLKLRNVDIANFRGIRSGAIAGLANVNLVVGRNNSGKSTVIEAIMRTAQIAGGIQNRWAGTWLEEWQDIRKQRATAPPSMWFRSDTTKSISVSLGFGDDPATQITWRLESPSRPVGDIEGQSDDAKKYLQVVGLFRPRDAESDRIEQTLWPTLLSTRADKTLISGLKAIFGMEVEQLQVPPDGRMLLLFPDFSVPLDSHGDGTRSVLRSLMLLATMRDTMLFIEDPEAHQNPSALSGLARVLCDLARKQEVQLFISTHSLEAVRAFLAAVETPNDVAVFHFDLHDGALSSRRLVKDVVERLVATGVDPRSLDVYL